MYLKTVGQNTNLLLNVAANNEGVIVETSVQRYKEFGDWIDSCFSNKSIVGQNSGIIKVQSSQPMTFDSVVIQENQTNGQSVRNFTVQVSSVASGYQQVEEPTVIGSGSSIGHKVIISGFASGKMTANEVTVNVIKAEFEPTLSVSLHLCGHSQHH